MAPITRLRLQRSARLLIIAVLVLSVLYQNPVHLGAQVQPEWRPTTPVTYVFPGNSNDPTVGGELLAFNDFHGRIDPESGSAGQVNGTPAGGSEYLGTALKALREDAIRRLKDPPSVVTVSSGDNCGAEQFTSAQFKCEPTIEIFNKLGVDISAVGNHDLDRGKDELLRLQRGGCVPGGCGDPDGFSGATFQYLAANTRVAATGSLILPPFTIRLFRGVPVAFLGMTLKGTAAVANPNGVKGLVFDDEVDTANRYADLLDRNFGVHAIVLLIHEGGSQAPPPAIPDVSSCANFAGKITDIVARLRPEFGVVVSGHSHRAYSCALPNSSGANSVVTQANRYGTLVTDIQFTVNRRTGRFATASAGNVIVENGVRNPDGTWQKDANNNFVRNPDLVDPQIKLIADKFRQLAAPAANRVVGSIAANIPMDQNAAGESALGDVVADGMLRRTASAGAQLALMNIGGLRASLNYSGPNKNPGEVTFGECFAVQPFGNVLVTKTFTGAQIKDVLEQQFKGYAGQDTTRFLQVSSSLSYSYDTTLPLGGRISDLRLNGVPIDPAAKYRVTINDFLANPPGGDGFSGLAGGVDPDQTVTQPDLDIDSLVAYLSTGPISPGPQDRIHKIA